jgi:hypothetical protein
MMAISKNNPVGLMEWGQDLDMIGDWNMNQAHLRARANQWGNSVPYSMDKAKGKMVAIGPEGHINDLDNRRYKNKYANNSTVGNTLVEFWDQWPSNQGKDGVGSKLQQRATHTGGGVVNHGWTFNSQTDSTVTCYGDLDFNGSVSVQATSYSVTREWIGWSSGPLSGSIVYYLADHIDSEVRVKSFAANMSYRYITYSHQTHTYSGCPPCNLFITVNKLNGYF